MRTQVRFRASWRQVSTSVNEDERTKHTTLYIVLFSPPEHIHLKVITVNNKNVDFQGVFLISMIV